MKIEFKKDKLSYMFRDIVCDGVTIGALYRVRADTIGWMIDLFGKYDTTKFDGYLYTLTAARKEIVAHIKEIDNE